MEEEKKKKIKQVRKTMKKKTEEHMYIPDHSKLHYSLNSKKSLCTLTEDIASFQSFYVVYSSSHHHSLLAEHYSLFLTQ